MSKKAVVWIRDDFRIKNNSALSYATNNYDTVTALYIYNKENFDDIREYRIDPNQIGFKMFISSAKNINVGITK